MRRVVAMSGVTKKICLQPTISTAIHDKDDIRGVVDLFVVSRIESVDRLVYFFLNRTTLNAGQRKERFVADEDRMMSPYCASIVLTGLWRESPLKRDPCPEKQGNMTLSGGQLLRSENA